MLSRSSNTLKLAIIQSSSSNWASPLLLKKTPGDWHPCGDNRAPNKKTTHDCYPFPRIQDFSSSLHGCSFLETCHQIHIHLSDVPKMAITTSFDLFEFICVPFDLCNACLTLQWIMDQFFVEEYISASYMLMMCFGQQV